MAEQSNITLRIDAVDGGAEQALLKVEQADRRLDVAVKVGNKTLRERVSNEADLAKVLQKVEDGEKKAATAGQRRAAASLQAQRSAALYRQHLERQRQAEQALAAAEAERDKRGRMAALGRETMAKAQALFEDTEFKRSQRRLAEQAAAQDKLQRGFRAGVSSAAQFAAGLIGVGGAAGVAALAMREVSAENERVMAMARRGDQRAKGLKEFIGLQAEGPEGQAHVRATLAKGASMGLTPEQAAAIAQPIQSVVDTDGDGRLSEKERSAYDEDLTAAFRLAQLGISPEDAQTVVTSGRSKGKGGRESADKLAIASDLSAAGPADFARSASAMGQFEDADTALAVATALTQEEKNFTQLPTLVRGAALALNSAADESELSKKFGLKGLSENAKIAKLRQIGASQGKGATADERIANFSRSLKNYGLDEEKARALGILVRQGDVVASARERIAGVEGGLTERKVAALQADALTGSSMAADEAAATSALRDLYGPDAGVARARRARAITTGARLLEDGGAQAVDPETGEAVPWYTWAGFSGRFEAQRSRIAKGERANIRSFFTGDADAGGGGDVTAALRDLRDALVANTQATQQNSASASRKGPVGGAASNAEESR